MSSSACVEFHEQAEAQLSERKCHHSSTMHEDTHLAAHSWPESASSRCTAAVPTRWWARTAAVAVHSCVC
jgi:hypothetical protein